MKTNTVVEQPLSKLDQLSGEVNRLRNEIEADENKLAAANNRSLELVSEIEAAEDSLIHGRIEFGALKALRDQHAGTLSEAVQLASSIRTSRRLLEKAQSALREETDRSIRERRQQNRRRICEQVAPHLDQAAAAITSLLSIDGIADVISLNQKFEAALTIPDLAIREVLAGPDSALAVLIGDLKKQAPDLVTSAMQTFLELRPPRVQRPAQPAVDSKVANRNAFAAINAQLRSWENAWFSRASDARSIPQVGRFA